MNELVDSVATACRHADPAIARPKPNWQQAPGNLDLSWANFVYDATPGGSRPILRDGIVNWKMPSLLLHQLLPEELIPIRTDNHAAVVQFDIEAVTVNVQSAVGKYQYLEQQMVEKGANVVFIQESKARPGLICSKQYLRYASDSENHWGTEVWVARNIPLATGGGTKVCVDESIVAVIAQGPRKMSISVRILGLVVYLSSLHFPSATRPIEEIHGFRRAVDAECCHGHHIIGADANARVPKEMAGVTGGMEAGDPDPAGYAFTELLCQHGYWLPSTFDDIHSAKVETWRHLSGKAKSHRLFCIRRQLALRSGRDVLMARGDLLCAHDDHIGMFMRLRCKMIAKERQRPALVRGTNLDLRALKDPRIAGTVAEVIASTALYQVPWEMDVNAHAQFLQTTITAAMEQVLPKKDSRPRANYINDQVWKLRALKHQHKKRTASRKDGWKLDVLAHALRMWRATTADVHKAAWRVDSRNILIYELHASAIRMATHKQKKMIARNALLVLSEDMASPEPMSSSQLSVLLT